MSRLLLACLGLALSLSVTKVHAADVSITICNRSENPFRAALFKQSRYQGVLVWGVQGWVKFPAGKCGYAGRITDHWGGLVFSVGVNEGFKPFKYTPSRQFNRWGPPPTVTEVCVTKDGSDFSRGILSQRDLSRTCPQAPSAQVPVSLMLNPGFSDANITLNVRSVPATLPDPDFAPPPELTADLSKWEGYIEQCVPDLISRYAHSQSTALFTCTCYATAAELSVAPERHSYAYPSVLNVDYDTLPEQEQTELKGLNITCHSRYLKTDPEFEELVVKKIALIESKMKKDSAPPELGVYLGMTANINSDGPLKLQSVDANSAAYKTGWLRDGDIIYRADNAPVKNLTELSERVNAAIERGQRSISLSVERPGSFFNTTLEF